MEWRGEYREPAPQKPKAAFWAALAYISLTGNGHLISQGRKTSYKPAYIAFNVKRSRKPFRKEFNDSWSCTICVGSFRCDMRNIFDQYSQPENRLTHALMTALHLDRDLLQSFLRQIIGVKPPCATSKLNLLTQCSPGLPELSEANIDQKGIPDGWIYSEDHSWCVNIENKVTAAFDVQQVKRHIKTAEKMFETVIAAAILPIAPSSQTEGITILQWSKVYEWLVAQSNGQADWAGHAAQFIEVLEGQRIQEGKFMTGNLTKFMGFSFSKENSIFSREASRQLKLAVGELRDHKLLKQLLLNDDGKSIFRNLDGGVWTTLNLEKLASGENHSKHAHLTLSVSEKGLEAMLTLPNQMKGGLRKNMKELGEGGFLTLTSQIVEEMKPMFQLSPQSVPLFRGKQRRYRSQKDLNPQLDALIEGDLRTALVSDSGPKHQPVWLNAAYNAFIEKSGNYQLQLGARFSFQNCKEELNSKNAIELVALAWRSCVQLLKLVDKN